MLSHKMILVAIFTTFILSTTPIIPSPTPAKPLDPKEVQKLLSSSTDSPNPKVQDLAKNYKSNKISDQEFVMGVMEQSQTGDAITELAEEEAKRASLNFHKDLQNRLWDNYYSNPAKMHSLRTYRRDCFR
jgi:hypothetical protein